ncbi:hypothetical protein MTO96_035529 [Rhipicephalus appendiculatus]
MGKPDDRTKRNSKDSDGTTEEEAAISSEQQKPEPNGSFSMSGYAVVAPAFNAAQQDVTALNSASLNPPAGARSKNSQVNLSEVKHVTPSPMTTATPHTFGYPITSIGSSFGVTFGANPPMPNSQVNQSSVGHAAASPMLTASTFSSGSARLVPEVPAGFSIGANPPHRERPGEPKCERPGSCITDGNALAI